MLAKCHVGELSVGELSCWRNIGWQIVTGSCRHDSWQIVNWQIVRYGLRTPMKTILCDRPILYTLPQIRNFRFSISTGNHAG
jgi:hypothetical protein